MELAELVQSMGVIELSAKTRPAAIRTLVQALELDDSNCTGLRLLLVLRLKRRCRSLSDGTLSLLCVGIQR